jgi:hypothetical protein
MKIVEVTASAKVNPFAADIATLAEMTLTNPKAGGEFEFPTADIAKAKYKISKAANDINLTASYTNEASDGVTTTIVVKLKPRHKATSGAERLARREAIKAEKAAEMAAKSASEKPKSETPNPGRTK